MKLARELGVWFHRAFCGEPDFKPGPFLMPDDPSARLVQLQEEQAKLAAWLQDALQASAAQAELARNLEAQADQERQMAAHAVAERQIYEQLADEAGARAAQLEPDHDLSLLSESPAVMVDVLDVLDVIRRLDKDHYLAMEALATTPA